VTARVASDSPSDAIATGAPAIRRRRLGDARRPQWAAARPGVPGEVTPCAYQGQLRVVRARREGLQQRPDGLRLPVHGQAERMVGEQPGRVRPVARRLGVPDGVGNLAMLDEPLGGAPVQRRHLFGQRPA
jgi:hypothetical protein